MLMVIPPNEHLIDACPLISPIFIDLSGLNAQYPLKVLNYYIIGYLVIKKWVSYREKPLFCRPLSPGEVEEVTSMPRRLAAIVLLELALNAKYQRLKAIPNS
jgi:hypothetical protein